MPIKNKMYKRTKSIVFFRDTPAGASTSITAAVAAGALSVNVDSAAGITAGKVLRIGSGEEVERVDVVDVVGTAITFAKPLLRAHAAAEPAVEMTGYDLGEPTGGFEVGGSLETTDVQSDARRLMFAKLPGYGSATAKTSILGLTLYALAAAWGIPFSRVTGAKTTASPLHLVTDFNDVDSVQDSCVVATVVTQDNSVRTIECWGVSVDYTAFSVQLATGQAGAVPLSFVICGGIVEADGAPVFTPLAIYRGSKASLFGRLTGFGFYAPAVTGAASTTLSAVAAADAAELSVASNVGFNIGDWISVSADDLVEVHQVGGTAAGKITLRTKLLRAQASGTTVTRLTRHKLATTRDGVTLALAGQVSPLYEGSRTMAVGQQPGNVDPSVSAQLNDLSLANRALALGIPASAIANDRLLATEQLGSTSILALYLEGMLADGVTVNTLNLWGCGQDLASTLVRYGGTEVVSMPFIGKPGSGIQAMQAGA